jgi:hypothetical protein
MSTITSIGCRSIEQPDEVWYVDNQLYPYWRTALMELSRTQTEVIINPAVEGDDELEAAAKFAQGPI